MIKFEEMRKMFKLDDKIFNFLKKANIRVSIDIDLAADREDGNYQLWAYSENQMWNWVEKIEKMPEAYDVGWWYDNGAYVCTFKLK